MKKNIKKFILLSLLPFILVSTSCDELNQLALNIPVVIEFSPSDDNTTVTESEYFCLSQYDAWRENQDDIESTQFIGASYWTLEGSSPNLQGNVTFTLYDGFGGFIFSVPLGNITADEYLDEPKELQLTVEQVDAFNAILGDLPGNDGCFTGELTVTDVTGQLIDGEYKLNGKVEVVLEAAVSL